MSTLATCIRKAGKSMNPVDVQEVTTLRDEYLKDGVDGQQASLNAIRDVIGLITDERNKVLKKISKAGGAVPGDPRIQFSQNQTKEFKDLDMSKAARMKRAKEMGFDTSKVLYHGTDRKISNFKTPSWFTDNKRFAENFATTWSGREKSKDTNVVEVFVKMNNPYTTEDWSVTEPDNSQKMMEELQAQGYDGVIFTNPDESTEKEYVVFDPKNIRSVNAAFDPNESGSSNLLFSQKPKLDMSKAARMKRAKEMGFDVDTVWYHGSYGDSDISAKKGPASDGKFRPYAFFTDKPPVANSYSVNTPNATSVPVYLNRNNFKSIDYKGREWFGNSEDINDAKTEGYDGVIIRNVYDPGNYRGDTKALEQSTVTVVFDPKNIRSVNAAFDPNESGSSNLLFSQKPSDSINLGNMVNTVRESSGNLASSIKNGDIVAGNMDKVLATIPMRYLKDFAPPKMVDSVNEFSDLFSQLEARANELQEEYAPKINEVRDYVAHNPEAEATVDLMYESTLAGVDPSKNFTDLTYPNVDNRQITLSSEMAFRAAERGYKDRLDKLERDAKRAARDGGNVKETMAYQNVKSSLNGLYKRWKQQKNRKAEYPGIKKQWDTLSPESQGIYEKTRDIYKALRDQEDEALAKRLTDLAENSDSGMTKQLDRVRAEFENNTVEEPYFKLFRTGKFWVASYNAAGETDAFWRFETLAERREKITELKDNGIPYRSGKRFEQADIREIDPTFAANVVEKVQGLGGSEAIALADAIWQQHLDRLPEMSIRKQQMHRKKRKGFEKDIMRALSHSAFHGSNQIAKLEFSGLMDRTLEEIGLQAKNTQFDDDKTDIATDLHVELEKRLKWIRNPSTSTLATRATQLGFFMYLGVTPAAALVNMSQTAIVAFPVLGAEFGMGKSMNAILRAGKDAFRRGGIEKQLSGDELDAFHAFHRRGLLTKTQSHDLAGISQEGVDYDSSWNKVMELVATPFHRAEVWNREATAMAAYRLARDKGLTHDEAVSKASELTWTSHFDYSNSNRPRFMQNDVAKVIFLFKQYSLNMTYRLVRDFHDMRKGMTPEQRREAGKRFAGILGMTSLFAGAAGMPLFTVTTALANMLIGDEDDPYDMEVAMRSSLAELFGQTGSQIIMDGAVNATTGMDIASRVSLDNMWLRDPLYDLEGRSLWQHYTGEMLGPVFKLGESYAEGSKLIGQENYQRGIELMLPKFGRDVVRGLRFYEEGAVNLKGDPILDQSEFSGLELTAQTLGFVPSQLSLQYKQNNAIKKAESRIRNRRSQLLNRYALALRFDDPGDLSEAIDDIKDFNEANSQYPITNRTIKQSMKTRARHSRESFSGITLDKNLRYLVDDLQFVD